MSRSRFLPLVLAACLIVAGVGLSDPHVLRADDDQPLSPPPANVRTKPELVALGGLAASDIWTSWILTGVLAESVTKKTHTVEQAKNLLGVRRTMHGKARANLRKVGQAPRLVEADKRYVARVDKIYEMLQTYVDATLAHLEGPTEATGAAFQAARTKSWAEIKDILGLE